jgi:Cu-processing system permease protein
VRLREVGVIAGREVRDATRSRWFVWATIAFFLLSLALAWLGLSGAERSGFAGYDRTTASLLNLALLFVPLVTLIVGGSSFAGEIEDGSLGLLLSQPLTRGEIYAGKCLGLLGSVTAAILVGFGATGVVVGLLAGGDATRFLALIGISVLLAAVTLSIGVLLSVLLRTRARVIGAAFAVWVLLVYVSDLGTIGLVVSRGLEPGQVFTLSLLNPVQEARVLGTLAITGRADVLGPVGLYGVDTFGAGGLVAVLIASLSAGAAATFGAGYAVFRRCVVP